MKSKLLLKTCACLRVGVNIGSISIPAFDFENSKNGSRSTYFFRWCFYQLISAAHTHTRQPDRSLRLSGSRLRLSGSRKNYADLFINLFLTHTRTHANRIGLCVYPVRVCVCPVRVRITQNFLSTYFSREQVFVVPAQTFPHTFSRLRLCINQA